MGRPGRGLASQPGPVSPVATPGAPPPRSGPAHSRDQLEAPRRAQPVPTEVPSLAMAAACRPLLSGASQSPSLPEPREPAALAVPCPAPGGSASVPCPVRVVGPACGLQATWQRLFSVSSGLLAPSVCPSVRASIHPSIQPLFPKRWHLWVNSDKALPPRSVAGSTCVSEPWARSQPSARPGGAVASQLLGPGLTTPGWPWSPGVC